MSTTLTVWETGLATRLGVGRDVVRGLRGRFVEGVDWGMVEKRACWSPDGAKKVAEIVTGLASGVGVNVPVEKGASGEFEVPRRVAQEVERGLEVVVAPGPVVSLVVARVYPLNPHIVQAEFEGGMVRVRTTVRSDRLRRGQTVPARLVEGDLWEMVGKPDWRGEFKHQ